MTTSSLQLGVFDINGTIHGSHHISPEIQSGFEHLHQLGVKTTVITGRSFGKVTDLLGDYWGSIVSEDTPISLENGGRLIDNDGNNLRFHKIGATTLDGVISAVIKTEEPIRYIAYTPKQPGQKSVLWLPENGTPDEYIAGNGTFVDTTKQPLRSFIRRIEADEPCMIRVGSTTPDTIEALAGSNMFINDDELNILAEGVDKASGVEEIACMSGVAIANTLVAGNDLNDIPMFRLDAHQKVCVGDSILDKTLLGDDVIRVVSPQALGQFLMSQS